MQNDSRSERWQAVLKNLLERTFVRKYGREMNSWERRRLRLLTTVIAAKEGSSNSE